VPSGIRSAAGQERHREVLPARAGSIYYEEVGKGFPLLLISGGGLNSTIAGLSSPSTSIDEFKGEYRCIAADLAMRHRPVHRPGRGRPPWESYADDQLG
jgi:hypothetical protein